MYKTFCSECYINIYNTLYPLYLGSKLSNEACSKAERLAQHKAIYDTFYEGLEMFYPEVNATQIWNSIYSAHLKRKAGITNLEELDDDVIDKVVAGAQSWKKCSGHVFEEYIVVSTKERLASSGIRFVLQKDLTFMLHNDQINNDITDTEWLTNTSSSEDFDIYAIITVNRKNYVFGCIQAKTSIRDRVGRDRDFSMPAMDKQLWSVAVVLNGSYLAMPKFQNMVNGGGKAQYSKNGWHGMYTMSDTKNIDRIYDDPKLNLLVEHAKTASEMFLSARPRFNSYWKAVNNINH